MVASITKKCKNVKFDLGCLVLVLNKIININTISLLQYGNSKERRGIENRGLYTGFEKLCLAKEECESCCVIGRFRK